MPTFTPPTTFDVPAVNHDTPRRARPLLRYYGPFERGRTVLVNGSTVTTTDYPTQDELDAADAFYLGGHCAVISTADAAVLQAAGYTTTDRDAYSDTYGDTYGPEVC